MAALRSLDVELEAVTPLWIGGSDRQAELRPPTMRGCLRPTGSVPWPAVCSRSRYLRSARRSRPSSAAQRALPQSSCGCSVRRGPASRSVRTLNRHRASPTCSGRSFSRNATPSYRASGSGCE